MAVMLYDTAIRQQATYRSLMADWTEQVVAWSTPTPVLLGLPTYDDAGVSYHFPEAENLATALLGVHAGLARLGTPPDAYGGIALYCEWETDDAEWAHLAEHFLRTH
ncbi:MAG: hypothetical protein HYZ53_25270 [Planctomycetes bacterium]|nr:hypothetical protein [Planctomycetota bacterium]